MRNSLAWSSVLNNLGADLHNEKNIGKDDNYENDNVNVNVNTNIVNNINENTNIVNNINIQNINIF